MIPEAKFPTSRCLKDLVRTRLNVAMNHNNGIAGNKSGCLIKNNLNAFGYVDGGCQNVSAVREKD